ncbi:hypothetical protein BDF19DRAFT_202883 [Syncephalis fuscata]|nr:hypothetical protein BDF19DRAFT_202883 [Syncephalis fuscata]
MSEPGKVSSKILAVRSAWQFVYLNAFLNTFSDCVDKLEVDPAILEHELVRKVPGELLGDIHRALIKPLSISKRLEGVINEEAYPFTENPIPLENSEAYHLLPATTKLDLLWLLCDWHLQNNKDVRVKIDQIQRKAHNMDKSALNILSSQPVGFDKQQRSYWFFGGK